MCRVAALAAEVKERAATLKRASAAEEPAAVLAETTAPLLELAGLEETAWLRLRRLVAGSGS